MTRDDADALNRALDDLALDGVATGDDVDPDLLATVRWFQELGAGPLPDLAFRTRLEHDLMDAIAFVPTLSLPASVPRLLPTVRGQGGPAPAVRRSLRLPRWPSVAMAALLLTLTLAMVTLGPLRPGAERPRTIPAAVVPAATTGATEVPAGPAQFLWETQGDPASPPWNPSHLNMAPDGSIWVADGPNDQFQVFAPDGTLLEVWGTSGAGDGEFDFETKDWAGYDHGAVAFASDGTFYVADVGNHRIQKFGPDRSFLTAWGSEGGEPGQFGTTIDLVVDGQGRVYVLDSYRNVPPGDPESGAVQVFDAGGRFLAEWGAYGAEPGQLSGGQFGIGLDPDGTILIAEYDNDRVQRFSPEGELLQIIGGFGTDDGLFFHAMDAAVDAEGRVFVTDFSNARVQVFDRDGRFLATWGRYGASPGNFASPIGVAVGDDGTVYVTDQGRRLQAFRVGDLPEPAATPAT